MPGTPDSFSWPLSPDPFLWLEEREDPAALAWVDRQNARTRAAWCTGADFDALRQRFADAYPSLEFLKIPHRWKDWTYDLWQDEHNPNGIWRRTPWAAWCSGAPVWQTLLDFDALGAAEGTPWQYFGFDILDPDGDRALIMLSPDGSDALVVREFDLDARCFVDDGFAIAKAGKHTASWIDRDTLYVGWDNAGETLTRSGYPCEVRRWTRGTALVDAPVVFKAAVGDINVNAYYDPLERRHVATCGVGQQDTVACGVGGCRTGACGVDSFDSHVYYLNDSDASDVWHRYDVPSHVKIKGWQGWLLLQPRLDWECDGAHHPGGSLLAIREDAFLRGEREVVALFMPTPSTSECEWTMTRHHVIVSYLEDVQNCTRVWTPSQHADRTWQWQQRVFPTQSGTQAFVWPVESTRNDKVIVYTEDYLHPLTYWLTDLARDDWSKWELLKRWPTQFDAEQYVVTRGHAVSADGTRVPYTVIGPRAEAQMTQAATRPCLLSGSGGRATRFPPEYLAGPGIGWLARGGVYVVAHMRGGGEFGPRWHADALGVHRQRAFDDFIAVAETLIDSGVTSAAQLGIVGFGDGGLLVAACMVQRPEFFGAVVCEAPLLDMRRYHLLNPRVSWIDEYGDPDEADAARALAAYSPYHRVSADTVYPPVLFRTWRVEDSVHPGHGRKMAALMQAQGHESVWSLEDSEAAHFGSNGSEQAERDAIIFEFLWQTLSGSTAKTE